MMKKSYYVDLSNEVFSYADSRQAENLMIRRLMTKPQYYFVEMANGCACVKCYGISQACDVKFREKRKLRMVGFHNDDEED